MSEANPDSKPAGAFSPMLMIVLALVAVFSFSAFFTLIAFAPELSTGQDGRAHALSRSAVGYAGIVRLAEQTGELVSVNRAQRVYDPPGLSVVTPEHPLTKEELESVYGGAILIVLPKWETFPDFRHQGWVMRMGVAEPAQIASLIAAIAPKAVITQAEGRVAPLLGIPSPKGREEMSTGAIANLQSITGPGLTPIVQDAAGRTVLAQLPSTERGAIYVLAEPDLLNTQGIADLATARAGLAILSALRTPEQEIAFDVTLNGFGKGRSVLRLAFEPPFLAATLCLLVAAVLMGWRAALRTGPAAVPTRAIALGKSALADSSAALIRLARREYKMGAGYAALTGAGVAELIGAARKEETETTALLDAAAQAQKVGARFSDLSAEASSAQTPQRMLEAARKLHAWKEEMLRATR